MMRNRHFAAAGNRDRKGAAKIIFALLILLATAAALALRLPELDLRPMHGDEAVHTVKFNTLWESGEYVYDVHDYHGPTLYYFCLPSVWLSGADNLSQTTETTFRIVPVLFGVGVVLLLLLLGDGLGRAAAACAGGLTALSPAMVYYSRYYIGETLLVFFTFAALVAGWRYARSRRTVWALAAGACLGLMHATKETCVLAYAAMAAALLGTIVWGRRVDREASRKRTFPGCWVIVAGGLVGLIVSVLCFSVFFTNAAGPLDSLRAYGWWWHRAGGAGLHAHPWYYYLKMLLFTHYFPGPIFSEALVLLLAAVGGMSVLLGRTDREADTGRTMVPHPALLRFLVLYTLLMTAAYSTLPYKTPWCALEFLHPMILLAGVGAAWLLHRWRLRPVRILISIFLAVGTAHLGHQAYAASFRFPADNRNPYAYAHPVGDVKRLAAWIERLAAVHPDGHAMVIKVIAEDYWPLPWYLRGFERVGYWATPPDAPDAPVIVVSNGVGAALDSRLVNEYRINHYGLRPGEVLLVYVEQQLWEAFVEQQERGQR